MKEFLQHFLKVFVTLLITIVVILIIYFTYKSMKYKLETKDENFFYEQLIKDSFEK